MDVTTVVYRIAESEGRETLELPPLQNTVDVDALTKFIESADDNAEAQFQYFNYEVTIEGNGEITIEKDTGV